MSKVQLEFASAYFSCRRVEWMVSSLRVECRLRSSLSGMHVAFVLLNAYCIRRPVERKWHASS